MAPAWMTSRADPIEALRGASRSTGGNRRWAPKTLVIVQAAVSVVLLSAAAMLGQSLRNLEHQNFGFDTRGRYLVSIDTKISNYRQEQLVPLVPRHRGPSARRSPTCGGSAPCSRRRWLVGFGLTISGLRASPTWTRG